MRYLICVIWIIFLSNNNFSQAITKEHTRKIAAKENITKLKEGILLVRLQSRKSTIDILEKEGYSKRAEFYIKKQTEEHTEIIEAFKEFLFCKVYFFYSHDSEKLISGEIDSVKLMDIQFNSIKMRLDTFFIAEIGDLPTSYELDSIEDVQENHKGKPYSGGTNMGFKCLYLRDQSLELLTKPFPYYQRFHPLPLTKLTNKEVVTRFEKNLFKFYENEK